MSLPEPLTPTQRAILLSILASFADRIERVDIYGSRARGTHRPGSDVDLVLAGALDWQSVARIRTVIEESSLSIFADVTAYDLLPEDGYRAEVTRTAVPLFSRDDLLTAQQSRNQAA